MAATLRRATGARVGISARNDPCDDSWGWGSAALPTFLSGLSPDCSEVGALTRGEVC